MIRLHPIPLRLRRLHLVGDVRFGMSRVSQPQGAETAGGGENVAGSVGGGTVGVECEL